MSEKPLPDLTAPAGGLPIDDFGMSAMERKFADHALDLIAQGERFWRKKAADMAGYKEPRNAAYELIRRKHVIAYMAQNLTEAAETVKVDRSFVLFRALTNLARCEAMGDFRTAHRYLDIVAKHADVRAFTVSPEQGDQGGRLSLPFDPSALSTDELANFIALMRKAGGGTPL